MDRLKIKEAILRESDDNRLACHSAFRIAEEKGCAIQEVGALCNELKIKIAGCQLGCF